MNWQDWFMGMAEMTAMKSKDPSTKVGAVIVRPDNTIASMGYNGFPRGCDDSPSLYANRDEKYARTVHAELNAILSANDRLTDCSIFVTHPPCAQCAAAIIQKGIKEVIYKKPAPQMLLRWEQSMKRAFSLLKEAGVHYGPY